jgi:hypothetical protein
MGNFAIMYMLFNRAIFTSLFAAIVGLLVAPPLEYDATEGASSCRIDHIVFQQGHCGACLAFASSVALGYRICLNDHVDFVPSPFRIFDCLAKSCSNGLSIPEVEGARMQGIGDLNATPARFGWGCRFTEESVASSWVGYFAYGETSMKTDIYLFGPSVTSIYVDPLFYLYTGRPDVYQLMHVRKKPPHIDSTHAVAIIGWGDQPEPHWVIQNSWGAEWGNAGRAKVPIESITSHHAWRSDSYFYGDLVLLCVWLVVTTLVAHTILTCLIRAGKHCGIGCCDVFS